MAATRFDPSSVGERTPDQGLLDLLTAPGSSGAFRGVERRNPWMSLQNVVNQGNQNIGVGPLESYFQNGLLNDPQGLIRLLNVAGLRPDWSGPAAGGPSQVGGQFGNDLGQWLTQLNQTYGFNRSFSPESLAYRGPQIAPDLTLQQGVTSLDQLNQWAQQNYGTDFATFAAMSPRLRGTRQSWQQDPTQWFNPADPGAAAVTRVPGLNQADSALRLQQYAQGFQNQQRGLSDYLGSSLLGRQTAAVEQNPQSARTSYGAFLGTRAPAVANAGRAAIAATPGAPDYSYMLQQAMAPFLTSMYFRQASL